MFEEYIGKKYGNLTITTFDSLKKNGTPVFAVACECGNNYLKCGLDRLISGKTKDCGCSKRNVDLVGRKFGRLLVVEKTNKRIRHHIVWKCQCECGSEVEISSHDLIVKKSCGCIKKERKHFAYGTLIYRCWDGMNSRCYNKNKESYNTYGNRGITVCSEWRGDNPKGFSNFYDWAIANGWSDEKLPNGRRKYTLDRINNNDGYSPDNCRFVTEDVQQENKRNRLGMVYNGEYMLLTKIADINNISRKIFSSRIRYGWTLEDALNKPIISSNRKAKHINGYVTRKEAFTKYGISERQFRNKSLLAKIRYKIQKNTYFYLEEDIIKLSEYCKDNKNKYIHKYKDFNINATVL